MTRIQARDSASLIVPFSPSTRRLVEVGRVVGIIFGIEVSRLARNNSDWYQLLDLCALTDTLIADADGVYGMSGSPR